MTAPAWFQAEQRERAREYADMDRYYAEIDAQDEIDRAAGPADPSLVPCCFCTTLTVGGLCYQHGVTRW